MIFIMNVVESLQGFLYSGVTSIEAELANAWLFASSERLQIVYSWYKLNSTNATLQFFVAFTTYSGYGPAAAAVSMCIFLTAELSLLAMWVGEP